MAVTAYDFNKNYASQKNETFPREVIKQCKFKSRDKEITGVIDFCRIKEDHIIAWVPIDKKSGHLIGEASISLSKMRVSDHRMLFSEFLLDEKQQMLQTVSKVDRKSTRLNSSHIQKSRMPSSA